MTNEIKALSTQPPAFVYARLLIDLHRLIGEGKGDSEEAEAIADRMDAPWYAMTGREQARMRGLAVDLHAMRDGGPKRLDMSTDLIAAWRGALKEALTRAGAGDVDAFLNCLRKPIPSALPPQFTPFLQAGCWEKLGDVETALVFMQEAERLDPDQAISVMLLLQKLGRQDELPQYANRVIENSASPPLELYLAAVALLVPTRSMSDAEAAPILRRAVAVLKRALSAYLALSPAEREASPDADVAIAQALGLGLERLGELRSAIEIYSEAITKHPRIGDLFMARGLALHEVEQQAALQDLSMAARWGVAAIWPYLLLARHAIQNGAPAEALRLARVAENQPGPPAARAEVYEILGMALADLRQPQDDVLMNFDQAIALDPMNDRIRENRHIVAARATPPPGGRPERLHLQKAPPFKPESLRKARNEELDRYNESLYDQHYNRMSMALTPV